MKEMTEIVRAKADNQGKYTPESEWKAWKDWDFGQKKQPSRWLTFLVLRMLVKSLFYLSFLNSSPQLLPIFSSLLMKSTRLSAHQRGTMASHPGFLNRVNVHSLGQQNHEENSRPDRKTAAYSSTPNSNTATTSEQPP